VRIAIALLNLGKDVELHAASVLCNARYNTSRASTQRSVVDPAQPMAQCSRRTRFSMDDGVASRGWKVWLRALVPDIRFGRWLTALVSFALLYGAFRSARVFVESDEA